MECTRRAAVTLALSRWTDAEVQGQSAPSGILNRNELETLNRYAALIIPASPHSGGAAVAASPSLQRTWRRGLAAWAQSKDHAATLHTLTANEFSPKTQADQFFILFKTALVSAFYTSEEGITKELGYQGLAHLHHFPAPDGQPFETPANDKPLLRSR
ncbi:gluconate 2-dehydrogenase subunit 3 family protein [Bryobacter aggregatus]|uniref:gluconate 2-dehydrogenase subunit 3 family protein n=1 Tax=Bryobacter aggregatus TaxID=360054 RepID=UPI0004E0BA60|nr:gluconate 2-dehydrogenase subunit 3 family protein [Bryobacter aggregatus]